MDTAGYWGVVGAVGGVGYQFGPRTIPTRMVFAEMHVSNIRIFGLAAGILVGEYLSRELNILHNPYKTLAGGLQFKTPLGDHLRAFYHSEMNKDLGRRSAMGEAWQQIMQVRSMATEFSASFQFGGFFSNIV